MSDENKKEEQTKDGSFTFKVNKYVLIAMIVGLMIGFVAGREQMKYQIKSAVVDGFAEIFSPSTGGDKKAPEVEKKQETKKKETAPIVVASLLNKGYEKQGYQDYITFSIKFENFGNKNIRAVSGEVEFQNILGEVILPVNIIGPGTIDTRIGRMRSFSRLAKRREHEGPVVDLEQHASS